MDSMMDDDKFSFSITRSKNTWKPLITAQDLSFFEATPHNSLFWGVSTNRENSYTGTGRTLVGEPTYLGFNETIDSNNQNNHLDRLKTLEYPEVSNLIKMNYLIVGGFNNNAIEFIWESIDKDTVPTWVMLKTFTGTQTKYIMPQKRSPLVFALADEDAYVYCDEDPCLECMFRCKLGFVFYVFVPKLGLIRLPLTRMNADWASR
jgi:hypothetical protein